MATIKNIRDGLDILSKYDDNASVQGQRDMILVSIEDVELISHDDKIKLNDLGWHINTDFRNECWAVFT